MLTLRVHFYLEALSEWREEWQNWLLWNERVPCFFFSLGRLMTLKVCNLPQTFTTNSITASWVQHPESWELTETAGQGSAVPEHLSATAPFLTFLFPLLWGQYKATFSTAFLLAFLLCISTCNLLITRSVWQKQNHVYRFLNFPWPPRASPIPTAPARLEDARLDKACWDPPTASFSSNSVIIELAKRQFITRI